MGFLDKAKEQASALGAKAQESINQGQANLSDAQANKKAAGLLEQLGAWQWAQRYGRDGGQTDEQVARILAELEAHEAVHGPIASPLPPAPPAPPAPAPDAPAPPAPVATTPPAPVAPAPPVTPGPPVAPAPPIAPSAPPAPPLPMTPTPPPVIPEGGFTLD